jgi:hypothetical protein
MRGMSSHMRGGGGVTRGSRRRGRRSADGGTRRRVRGESGFSSLSHRKLSSGPCPGGFNSRARPPVVRSLLFKQGQHPLGMC